MTSWLSKRCMLRSSLANKCLCFIQEARKVLEKLNANDDYLNSEQREEDVFPLQIAKLERIQDPKAPHGACQPFHSAQIQGTDYFRSSSKKVDANTEINADEKEAGASAETGELVR